MDRDGTASRCTHNPGKLKRSAGCKCAESAVDRAGAAHHPCGPWCREVLQSCTGACAAQLCRLAGMRGAVWMQLPCRRELVLATLPADRCSGIGGACLLPCAMLQMPAPQQVPSSTHHGRRVPLQWSLACCWPCRLPHITVLPTACTCCGLRTTWPPASCWPCCRLVVCCVARGRPA